MPKISVITPCRDAERYVERAIASVRGQTFPDWEHIIVDDGSIDGSARVIEAVAATEPRLRLIHQPRRNRAWACKTGVAASWPDSRYFLFLDADDMLEPTMLEVLSGHLDLHPEVGLVYCDYCCIDANDNLVDKKAHSYLAPRFVPSLCSARRLPLATLETPFVSVFNLAGIICSLSLLRRSVYDCTPGWDEDFGFMYDDTDLFLQIAVRSKVHFLAQELVRYRRHAAQSTAFSGRRQAELTPEQQRWQETTARQEAKLYAKWLNMPDLTMEQADLVRRAYRFREGKFRLYRNFRNGIVLLRRGEFYLAARSFYGGLRWYLVYGLRRMSGRIK